MPSQFLSLSSPFLLSKPKPLPFKKTQLQLFHLPKLPPKKPRPVLSSSSSSNPTRRQQGEGTEEEEILRFVANASEERNPTLPCIRTFQNDLARLSLVASVSFDQALVAAAADGGLTATQHLQDGLSSMVVETVFPGPAGSHSTVSTRLFSPAERVSEKAKKIKQRLPEDVRSGISSKNILAMTFRQVVLKQLRNFEIRVFFPGSVRDMTELESPREVPASFLVRSSDERVLAMLAEVVCTASLRDTERRFFNDAQGRHPGGFFDWFKKREGIVSNDSIVTIDVFPENEILENARSLLKDLNSRKDGLLAPTSRRGYNWWEPVQLSKLDKMGDREFSDWITEYVHAYKLEIDADNVKDMDFEGWVKSADNKWEVLLTHSQMVGLAEVLDMFYEDVYSLPSKELPSSFVPGVVNLPGNKSSSLIDVLTTTLTSGILLVGIGMLSMFYFPHIRKGNIYTQIHRLLPPRIEYAINKPLGAFQSCGAWVEDIAKQVNLRGRDDNGSRKIPEALPLGESETWDKTSVPETRRSPAHLLNRCLIVCFGVRSYNWTPNLRSRCFIKSFQAFQKPTIGAKAVAKDWGEIVNTMLMEGDLRVALEVERGEENGLSSRDSVMKL